MDTFNYIAMMNVIIIHPKCSQSVIGFFFQRTKLFLQQKPAVFVVRRCLDIFSLIKGERAPLNLECTITLFVMYSAPKTEEGGLWILGALRPFLGNISQGFPQLWAGLPVLLKDGLTVLGRATVNRAEIFKGVFGDLKMVDKN